jgi:hypothetical protein
MARAIRLMWNAAHFRALRSGQRSLDTNIAVQRVQLPKHIERSCLAIRLTICFDHAALRGARFSPAPHVLPFPGLFLFIRPNSPLARSK